MKKLYRLTAVVFVLLSSSLQAQINPDTVKAGKYDNGKMWTFDFPPLDYFEKTYGFRPSQQWLDDVRMSALRFASWCSASFVSPDGLVMTNHHCARESGTAVQKPGENINDHGFLAKTLEEERRVPDLYVDQLAKIEDITARVQKVMDNGKSDEEKLQFRTQEFEAIKKEYAEKEAWKGLELQTITFYWGGKYSLYGFKRYNDVRLVAMPELALGFFGGDYDNFTYPRYCLDFSFFRVYDETGKPLKTDHYFKFNPKGAAEGDAVFVIGNPGSTNRQAPLSILEYLRDYSWPAAIKRFTARSRILQEYNKTLQSDSLLNEIFGFENTVKALTGQLRGLKDPYIWARRNAFERDFKAAVAKDPKLRSQLSLWDEVAVTQAEIEKNYYEATLLAPTGLNASLYDLANVFYLYATTPSTDAKRAGQMKQFLTSFKAPKYPEIEKQFLVQHIKEVTELQGPDHPYVKALKDINTRYKATAGSSRTVSTGESEMIAEALIKNTKLYDEKFRTELLAKDPQAILESKDPVLMLAGIAGKYYNEAAARNRQLNAKMTNLRARLALLMFQVYGTSIPPDATFSLRIADGVVKGYAYNGTKAPYKTTFAGMYDRNHSFDQKYPWALPEKWQNPPVEMLDEPVDFVSTNDIIGGNSGSPIINKNKEVVGLVFDGNMESLPGNYIFLPDLNRTVSVHAGGIMASLRYIYKTDRLVKELLGSK
jgi:hypothetical protein